MRKDLGRFLITLLLSWHVDLFASNYEWSAEISKNEAYVNEAIYLKYVCKFSDRGELYTIDFNPVTDNEDYSIKLFSQNTKIVDGKKISTYEYISYVKKRMLMEFNFDIIMEKTTQDSIENTVLGRDNVENEEFTTKIIRQNSLVVNIKESNSTLVGDFSIELQGDKVKVKAYEPYHLNIKLKGSGNFKALKPIKFKIDGVKVFLEKPIQNLKLTKDGYLGMWSQKFAFVSEKDFKIPAIKIEYFNLKAHSIKSLTTESIEVKVTQGFKKEELLDLNSEDEPLNFNFIYYIFTFIAGFLVAKIKFKSKKTTTKDEEFIRKIKDAKSLNELNVLLILKNQNKFNDIVSDIDLGKLNSISDVKKKVLNILKNI